MIQEYHALCTQCRDSPSCIKEHRQEPLGLKLCFEMYLCKCLNFTELITKNIDLQHFLSLFSCCKKVFLWKTLFTFCPQHKKELTK